MPSNPNWTDTIRNRDAFSAPLPETVSVGRREYETMRETLLKQDELLKRLTSQPKIVGMTLAVVDGFAYIAGPSGALQVKATPEVKPGQRVLIAPETNAITGILPDGHLPPMGMIGLVDRLGAVWTVSLDNSPARPIIVPPELATELRSGDRVVVDATCSVILRNLGKQEETHQVDELSPITWADIGGCAEAKKAIREAVEYPITHSELYAAYGKKPARGVLLYGKPGCGKTLLARATASAIAGTGPDAFLYVKGPELLSKWLGETERNIRRLFERAKAHKASTGRTAVIFIDEADALLSARDDGGLSVNMSKTIVPQFLAEMDGIEASSAFVMLSTNLASGLDPAVVRDGRIDRKVHVPRPDRESAKDIFGLCLRNQTVDTAPLIDETLELLFSTDVVVQKAMVAPLGEIQLHLHDLLSGAVIAGIVGRALDRAIERDRIATAVLISGLTAADLRAGVFEAARELADTNLLQDFTDKIRGMQSAAQTGN